MEEKEINHIIEQFDDSFLHHVSWMSEKKQQELNRSLEHLKELKNKKSILKLERNKLQEEIENISDLYEQELKKVLTLLASNIDAMENIDMNHFQSEVISNNSDNFALDIDRGDPIFLDEEK